MPLQLRNAWSLDSGACIHLGFAAHKIMENSTSLWSELEKSMCLLRQPLQPCGPCRS